MGKCFLMKSGGGGSIGTELNFTVVGGTIQPESPKENMIWVNTDVEITSWVIEATQPTSPSEGMVWISNSFHSTSEFNALSNNGLYIYPSATSQYVSGAWVTKEVLVYQNGVWNELGTFLFKNGEVYSDLTGGWSESSDDFGSATITNGCLTYTGSTKLRSTVNKITKGTATKLCVNVLTFTSSGTADGNIVLTGTLHQFGSGVRADCVFTSAGVKTIDLTSFTSTSFYVEIYTYGSAQMTIDKVWLE